MDPKEQFLIRKTHAIIVSGSFNERDVLALLILLRRHARPKTPICEFGDFVAHREKDRGVLKEFLDRLQIVLQRTATVDGKGAVFPIYTVNEIRDSLNEAFRRFTLEIIDDTLANQITVCIISLLQSVSVKAGAGQPAQKLTVGISSDKISLLGSGCVPAGHKVAFPVLVARNDFERLPEFNGRMAIDRILDAQVINGKCVITQQPAVA